MRYQAAQEILWQPEDKSMISRTSMELPQVCVLVSIPFSIPPFKCQRSAASQLESMDLNGASPASPEVNSPTPPQKRQHVDVDQQVNARRMPQYTSSGEPVSPQLATETGVDQNGCKLTYAELIYKALLGTEKRQMTLRELYDWFEHNTERARNRDQGWKNSVRSNLCLNEAFQRLGGKGSCWCLVGEDLKPTRKPRASRRKKVRVLTAERNSVAPPTPLYASKSISEPATAWLDSTKWNIAVAGQHSQVSSYIGYIGDRGCGLEFSLGNMRSLDDVMVGSGVI
ncbi:hypothetical protein CSUB01_10163 [Colletotrichum sublineola]|uniref:Fork-head domain-containing protein n=1 Tax=Colletotrichum sublineola TaxID=1173701 RepID=A0A066XC59_COLSU|nr:hypothetical protein CSUB01_10163 [Colletotrichum sublineola]